MFILYPIPLAILVGWLLGGRLGGLATLSFRWPGLAAAGFLVQAVLFSPPVTASVGAAGPIVYVLSTLAVLVFVLRNAAIPGLAVVALGAASNLAAIVANGGYMPVSRAALAAAGLPPEPEGYSNSRTLVEPVLAPLTDIFALPRELPFRNVYSVGDVLIALGISITVVWAMRGRSAIDATDAADAPDAPGATGATGATELTETPEPAGSPPAHRPS